MSAHANSSPQEISSGFIPSVGSIDISRFPISRRVVKIAFASALCSAGLFGMFSDSTYISSSDAVVSADIIDIRAPIAGTMSGLPLAVGRSVDVGQSLGKVDNPRNDPQHLDDLRMTASSSQSMFKALMQERVLLQAQQKTLIERANLDTSGVASRLEEQGTAAARTLSGLQQALAEATIELRRGEKLNEEGIIADADLDKLRSTQLVATEAVAAQQATLASVRSQTSDARRGILTEPGDASDVAYSRQRADEIAIKLADNASALTVARGQSDSAKVSVAAETLRENLMREYEVHAPVRGIIWKINTTDGEDILSGASVLSMVDCNQQFVLAQVPQDRVPDVALHRNARIRLAGESEERTGTVESISGDVLKLPNTRLAALPFQESSQQIATVLIALNSDESSSTKAGGMHSITQANSPCLVGRAVRVLVPTYSTNPVGRWIHELF